MTKVINQGDVDFSINYKVQTTWGFQEGLTFVLEGLGAMLFFLSLLAGHLGGMIAGILVLMASGVLLMMHLGNPKNMIYVLANIRHSWMSRGAALIPLFIGLGVLIVVAEGLLGLSLEGSARIAALVLFCFLTIFVLLKSGLVMTTFPAISFWNGGLLPIIFALSGMTSGMAVFVSFAGPVWLATFWLMSGAMALLLLALGTYVVTIKDAGRAAKVSVELISERHFAQFYGAGLIFGILMPLAIALYIAFAPSGAVLPLLGLMAAARVVGDIAMRDVILKVGVFDKVI
jgi:formate-dependent nitrite reductase membrane component NrfD